MARQPRNSDKRARRSTPPPRGTSATARWTLIVSVVAIAGLVVGWQMQSTKPANPAPQRPATSPAALAEVDAAVRRAQQCERDLDEPGLERELRTLIDLQPDACDWRKKLCRLLIRQSRSADAVAACRAALPGACSGADAGEVRIWMAEELIKLGEAASARAALEPLRTQSPQHPMLPPLWARMLRLEGKSDEALAFLQSVLPPNHGNGSAYQAIGLLQFDLGDYSAAMQSFRAAVELDPYSDVTLFKLAECARILGDRDAEQTYRQEYARLRSLRQEIDRLTGRYQREKSLSREEAARLVQLYIAIGQEQSAQFWRQKAAASRSGP